MGAGGAAAGLVAGLMASSSLSLSVASLAQSFICFITGLSLTVQESFFPGTTLILCGLCYGVVRSRIRRTAVHAPGVRNVSAAGAVLMLAALGMLTLSGELDPVYWAVLGGPTCLFAAVVWLPQPAGAAGGRQITANETD